MNAKPKTQFLTIQLDPAFHEEIKAMCKDMKFSMKEFAISAFDLEIRRFKKIKEMANPLNHEDFNIHLSRREA